MTSQRSRVSSRAAGGRAIPPGPVATPIPSADGRDPCRAVSRFALALASASTWFVVTPDCTPLPEGADALSGSFPIFPTIRQHSSPMPRQEPRPRARSSSASPATFCSEFQR